MDPVSQNSSQTPVGFGQESCEQTSQASASARVDNASAAETTPARTGPQDSVESEKRNALEAIQAKRRDLKPKLDAAEAHALWQLPKALPLPTPVSYALGQAEAVFNRDVVKAFDNGLGQLAKQEIKKGLKDAPALNEALSLKGKFDSATAIHNAMREYGALVKEDEKLKFAAQDIQMSMDPKAQFHYVDVGGLELSRTQKGLVYEDDKGRTKAADWSDGQLQLKALSKDEEWVAKTVKNNEERSLRNARKLHSR